MDKDLYRFFYDLNGGIACSSGQSIKPKCKFLCEIDGKDMGSVRAWYQDRSPNSNLIFEDNVQLKNKLQYLSFNEGWFDFEYDQISESLTCIRKTDKKEFFTITKI